MGRRWVEFLKKQRFYEVIDFQTKLQNIKGFSHFYRIGYSRYIVHENRISQLTESDFSLAKFPYF